MRRAVIVEVNELPPVVMQRFVESRPGSALSRICTEGRLLVTEAREDTGRYLYPSQSWASLASGVPYERHRIYWYGDPKPADLPLYWQAAAEGGRSVGVVGALHTSPLTLASRPGVRFAIPDCFAADPATVPARYRWAQAANLELTQRSGRRSELGGSVPALLGLATLPALGVRPTTVVGVAKLADQVRRRRVPRERLRHAQFLLFGDVFLHLVGRHQPDLAVVFTNHVASMMHRYWYAAFPGHWPDERYPEAWVHTYRHEIDVAVELLDRYLAQVMDLCARTERALVITSSMGQQANLDLDPTRTHALVVRDVERFARFLDLDPSARPARAMVPHVSWRYPDPADAERDAKRLRNEAIDGMTLEVDVADGVVTVTYLVDGDVSDVALGERRVRVAEVGMEREPVDDNNAGIHHPDGVLAVWNSPSVAGPDRVDVLEVAPAILELLGVEPLVHHQQPTFTL